MQPAAASHGPEGEEFKDIAMATNDCWIVRLPGILQLNPRLLTGEKTKRNKRKILQEALRS